MKGVDVAKAKNKIINYNESDGEDSAGDDVFKPKAKVNKARPTKRRRVSESGDEGVYEEEQDVADFTDGKANITFKHIPD